MTFSEVYAIADPALNWIRDALRRGWIFDADTQQNFELDLDASRDVSVQVVQVRGTVGKVDKKYTLGEVKLLCLPPGTAAGKIGGNSAVYMKMTEPSLNVTIPNRKIHEFLDDPGNSDKTRWPDRGDVTAGNSILLVYNSFFPKSAVAKLACHMIVWHEVGHAVLDRLGRTNLEPPSIYMELHAFIASVKAGYYQQIDPSFSDPRVFSSAVVEYLADRVEDARLVTTTDEYSREKIDVAYGAVADTLDEKLELTGEERVALTNIRTRFNR
ncbi:hypothetical protein ACGFX8_37885 [Streptomyces sp. NPDC048362]|uniref:hypothetical protein n=1 Tax=Streptomyces sp. NPDC048362 TaxID=3365539 RepID=UPI00371E6725